MNMPGSTVRALPTCGALRTALLCLLLPAILTLSCSNPFLNYNDADDSASSASSGATTGMLSIQFGGSMLEAQTVTPNPVDPATLTYSILLTRDGFTDIGMSDITGATAAVEGIPLGLWNIEVTGLSGVTPVLRTIPGLTVDIAEGANFLTAQLHPLTEGQGDISISITWPAGLVQDYDPVQSTFAQYPGGTSEEIIDHTVPVANGITYSRSDKASGYYRLAVYLRNAENQHVATVIQIIHVYDTLVSTKTIALTENEIAQPPSAPTGLVATQPNFFSVQLSWTDQSNVEEGFRVYRNGAEIAALGAGATSYADGTYTGGESYTYEVRSYNSFGESAAGLAVVGPVTPLSDTGLEGPANGSIDQPLMLNFAWDPGFGANALDLYILQGGTPVVTQENIEPTAGGYTLSIAQQLQRDTNYDWYLVARNADFEVATPTESFTTRGTTLYVDSTNGTNNIQRGTTVATPLLSIQYAIDEVALDDDLIEIAAGTYTEFVNVTKSVSLQGVGPATIISAPAGGIGNAAVTTGPGLNVRLMNLQVLIDTANETQFGIMTSGSGGDLSLLDLLIVHRGTSLANGYDAVSISNRDPLILSDNRIHILNPGFSNHAAIRISGAPDAVVTNNRINTVDTGGARVGLHLTNSPRARVVNNVMYRPGGEAAAAALHPEVRLITSPDVILAHNTFTRDDGRNDTTNGRGFVQLDALSGNLLLVNNIFSVLGGVPNGSAIYFDGSAGPGSFQALEGNLFLNFTNLFQDLAPTAHTSISELNGWAYAVGNFDVFALSYVADTFESDTWLQPDTVARSLVAAGGSRNFIAEIPDDIAGVSRGDGSVPVGVGAHHIPGGELLGAVGPSGGWIFYENPNYHTDGWRFMEAAPADTEFVNRTWGTTANLIGTSGAIGDGLSNTTAIVTNLGDYNTGDYAARLAQDLVFNGYDDWFLPSRFELVVMYDQLRVIYGVGDFQNAHYWSSTEDTADNAWTKSFNTGADDSYIKTNALIRVRAARRF